MGSGISNSKKDSHLVKGQSTVNVFDKFLGKSGS
jgi:hypothetical protein